MKGTAVRVSLFVALLCSSAAAQAAGKRIGVAKFEGAQEAMVRRKVMASLKSHGFEVVGSREVQDALGSGGASLDSDDGLVSLAKELALSAIVTGEVGPKRAKVVVHDGAEGSILGDASFTGANATKLATTVGLEFWKKLGPDVGRGHVPSGAKKAKSPAEEEETAAGGQGEAAAKPKSESAEGEGAAEEAPAKKKRRKPKMEEPPPEESAGPGTPSGLSWLDFEVGLGGVNRSLRYTQNVSVNGSLLLLPYTLGLGPILVANAVAYPLDPLLGGAIGGLGLELEIQQGFAISSTLSGGQSFANTVHDYAGGLRYRFPFAGNDIYLSFTAGEDAFTFSGMDRPTLPIPDTIYHYVRPGLGMHFLMGGVFSLALGGGYRAVLNGGGPQLSDPNTGLFPHLTVAGADAEAVLGYRLGQTLEARAGVEWRRYWFTMHSQMNDRAIAGGMVDQSFSITARIAILIGSSSVPKSEGGAAEEPPPPPPPTPKGRGKSGGDEGGESDSGEAAPSVKTGGEDE